MPDFNINFSFEVLCSCGNGLCNQTDTRYSRGRNEPQIVVTPCKKCAEAQRKDGYDEGYADKEEELK